MKTIISTNQELVVQILSKYALKPSQIDISILIMEGLSNSEIADQLGLSEGTVKKYVNGILVQTGKASRLDFAVCMVAEIIRRGYRSKAQIVKAWAKFMESAQLETDEEQAMLLLEKFLSVLY